jgi:hypothetical protein
MTGYGRESGIQEMSARMLQAGRSEGQELPDEPCPETEAMLVQQLRSMTELYCDAAKQIGGCIYNMASVYLRATLQLVGTWKDLWKGRRTSRAVHRMPSSRLGLRIVTSQSKVPTSGN